MKNILVTGGTGLIGSKLISVLQQKGYSISILSRSERNIPNVKTYVWDIDKKVLPQEAIDQADCIVHLAGANVGSQKWTEQRKQDIIDSRVKSGELLLEKIKESSRQPAAFISASAVGYYGLLTSDKIFNESHPPANDFFGKVGEAWEQVLDKTAALNIRSLALRLGVVLAQEEGALPKMSMPLKFGIGTPIGSGKQWVPWIHIDDAVAMFVKAIEDKEMQGAFNAASPTHCNNAELMKTLCKVRNRLYIPIGAPAIMLKLVLGKMANIVLKGSRVSSEKIVKTGYKFKYESLEKALQSLS